MTRYVKRKLKYSLSENFNLLPYVEWDRFVTITGAHANEGYVIVSRSQSGPNRKGNNLYKMMQNV